MGCRICSAMGRTCSICESGELAAQAHRLAERDALVAEVEKLQQMRKATNFGQGLEVMSLKADNDSLRAALLKYGAHQHVNCIPGHGIAPDECYCGLDAAIKGWKND